MNMYHIRKLPAMHSANINHGYQYEVFATLMVLGIMPLLSILSIS